MLNRKSFVYQAGLLASSNMLLQMLNFLYRILLGRMAGPEGLGVYTLTIQVYGIVMSICVSGMTVAVTNLSASLRQAGDTAGIRCMIRFALGCYALLLAALAIPIILFRESIAQNILGDSRTAQALVILLACIFLTGIENILKALFNGIQEVKYTAASELGEQLLRILLMVFLLRRFINGDHGHTSYLIIAGMTLSELYSVAYLGSNYMRVLVRQGRKGKRSPHIRRRFLWIAVPAAATALCANLFSSAATVIFPQRLLLAGYTHAQAISALGLLSGMVMPILMLPSALISALCTLLMPNISAGAARGDRADLQRKIRKGIEAAGLIGLPATAMLLPFAPLLCILLFGQTAPTALVIVMSLEVVVTYYLMLTVSVMNGLGKQRQVFLFAAGSEILQLGLVWVLSAKPELHVYGYLLGILAGDLLRAILGFAYIHRIARLSPRLFHAGIVPFASAIILYCCARMGFFFLTSQGMTIILSLVLSFAGCVAIYAGLLRLVGLDVVAYVRHGAIKKKMV